MNQQNSSLAVLLSWSTRGLVLGDKFKKRRNVIYSYTGKLNSY
jgi:hypothetical protein